ncbi:hypothetical protein ACWF94_12485 [Streptomyces sp. NPDC055078]
MDDWGRSRLERQATDFLTKAGEEKREDWPSPWRGGEETDFDRIAAAHSGLVPLGLTSVVAALPDFDPERAYREMADLMSERPGVNEPDCYGELLSLLAASRESGEKYGSGFLIERRSFPPEGCRWMGCNERLYASGGPRGKGQPRKYCSGHQKAAKRRTQRLRRRGISVGTHRNLSYRPSGEGADVATWKRNPKVGGTCTDQFQQSRDVWEELNLPQRG